MGKRRSIKNKRCECMANKTLYYEYGVPFEYTFRNIHYKDSHKPVDIVILTEFREPELKRNFLAKLFYNTFNTFNYAIVPSLGCTPSHFMKKKDVKGVYIRCKERHIKERIQKLNPKVIITVGRALYSITEGATGLISKCFFTPLKNCKSFQEDDSFLYSPEFKCRVYPIPPIYQWLHDTGKEKDVYETLFVRQQVNRVNSFLKNFDSYIITEKKDLEITILVEDNPNDFLNKIISDEHIKDIVIDTESEGLNPFKDKLTSVQISYAPDEGHFFYWDKVDKELFKKLFTCGKNIIMHNGIYDCKVFLVNGIENVYCSFDTLLASYHCNESMPKGLKSLTWVYTCHGGYEKELDQYRKENKVKNFVDLPEKLLIKYGCYDSAVTYQLFEYFKNRLDEEDEDVRKNYYEYIIPAIAMFADLEVNGVNIDLNYLIWYNAELVKKRDELEEYIYSDVGEKFNLRSNKQLSTILINKYGVVPNSDNKTATGDIQVNKTKLSEYRDKYKIEIIDALIEHSHLCKEISQLGIEVYEKEKERTGFLKSVIGTDLYPSYKLHGAVSGRTSGGSDKDNRESVSMKSDFGINFQNIPATAEFRKIFLAPENYVWGRCDYDSMEIVIQSQVAGKGALYDMIKSGKEMHTTTACAVYKLQTGKDMSYEEMFNKAKIEKIPEFVKIRDFSKTVNFQLQYGGTKYGLSHSLGITPDEAQEYVDAYFQAYPEVKEYVKRQHKFVQATGYVKTLLGKKRRLPQLTYIGKDSFKNKYVSSFSVSNLLNNAINVPIQGTSGQTTIIAMTKIWEIFKQKKLKSRVIVNVHDEICFFLHRDEIDQAKDIIETCMTRKYYENMQGNDLSLTAEMEMGEVWKEEKPLKFWDENPSEKEELFQRIDQRNRNNRSHI